MAEGHTAFRAAAPLHDVPRSEPEEHSSRFRWLPFRRSVFEPKIEPLVIARRFVIASVIGGSIAAPWLVQSLVWCSWIGVAAALAFTPHLTGRSRICWTAYWSILAIGAAFHWSPDVLAYTMDSSYQLGLAVYVPFVLWDAARLAIPFLIAARWGSSANQWLFAALATVVLEAITPVVFPWRLGYSQIAWPWTIQGVEVFGPSWTSIILFAHAGLLLFGVRIVRNLILGIHCGALQNLIGNSFLVALVACNACYGLASSAYWSEQIRIAPKIRITAIQVDPSFVDSLANLQSWTKQVPQDAELVCWPESSGGTYEESLASMTDEKQLFKLSKDPNRGMRLWQKPTCPLLVGGKTYLGDPDRPKRMHQTAMLFDLKEQIVARYQKRHLMPFGEFVPGETWVPGITHLFSVRDHITAGENATVVPVGTKAKVGTMLCYEDMMPEAAR